MKNLLLGIFIMNMVAPVLYAQPNIDDHEEGAIQFLTENCPAYSSWSEQKKRKAIESFERGRKRKEREIIARMLLRRIQIENIAEYTQVSIEEIIEIKEGMEEIAEEYYRDVMSATSVSKKIKKDTKSK